MRSDSSVTGHDFAIFGRNVRRYRKASGLLVKDLAKLTGLGLDTIRRIERGQPCFLNTQHKLADKLCYTLEALWAVEDTSAKTVFHFDEDRTRWSFFDINEAAHWGLNPNPEQLDPDAIQDSTERRRIARSGLADS